MRRLRAIGLGLILATPALAPAISGSAAVCAAEARGAPHAALVVGTGTQTTTYCVSLGASSVSGLRLIELAGQQYGMQYRLGFGGQAVCQLSGVGASGGDCFGEYPDFWGYWHGNGSGGWSWAGSGAASASIEDGDVEGWVWGSGDSGATHPSPPALAFKDVCEEAEPTSPPPTSPPGNGGGGGGSGGGSGGSGGGGSQGGGSGSNGEAPTGLTGASGSPNPSPKPTTDGEPDDKRSGNEGRTPAEPSVDGSVVQASPGAELAAGVTDEQSGGGPPAGAIAALVAISVFGAGGWLLRRRQIARGGD